MNNGGQNQSVPSCVHRGGHGEATADSNCGSFHRVSFHREAPGQSVTQHLNRSKHTSTLTCLRFTKTKGKRREWETRNQIFTSVQIFTWNKTGGKDCTYSITQNTTHYQIRGPHFLHFSKQQNLVVFLFQTFTVYTFFFLMLHVPPTWNVLKCSHVFRAVRIVQTWRKPFLCVDALMITCPFKKAKSGPGAPAWSQQSWIVF